MAMTGMYLGPDEFIRRYMAGLTVAYEDMFLDGSPWTIKHIPKWHLIRLAEVTREVFKCANPNCDGVCLACHGPKFEHAVARARAGRPAAPRAAGAAETTQGQQP